MPCLAGQTQAGASGAQAPPQRETQASGACRAVSGWAWHRTTAPGTLHLEAEGNGQIGTLKTPGGKQSAVRQSENTAPKMARDGLEG